MKKLKILLTPAQIESIQSLIVEDYIACRMSPQGIAKGWLNILISLGDSIEKQTGITNDARIEMQNWHVETKANRKAVEKEIKRLEEIEAMKRADKL